MEPFEATQIVLGLVGSLVSICKVLEEVASHSATDWFGSIFKDAVAPLKNYRRELDDVQNSLRTSWMQAQLERLSSPLKNIEGRLETLEESIQDVDRYRTTFLSRWQIRGLYTRDIEEAKSSILLAMNMVNVLKVVQRHIRDDRLRIEDAGRTSTGVDEINSRSDISTGPHDLGFFTDDIATIWRINQPLSLVTEPDRMVDQILARVAAPEPQEEFHAQCRAARVAGTCQWFLETHEFQSWRKRKRPTGDRGILWCQGRPGIGKTILASKIIDDIRVSESVVYYYMSSGRLHSASDVVASLLKQLCLPFHFLPSRLKQVYDQAEDQPHLLLELDDMLEALKETSRYIPHQPITIVVDGLDEVNMIERKHFVKVLANLKENSWNWLFTSRPDQDFMDGALEGCSKFFVENFHLYNDIRNLLGVALRGNDALHTMLRDEALRRDVLKTLTSRAQGSFYWATLQIRLILDQTHPSGIQRALQETPSTICGIVQSAMEMMRQQYKAREQLARRALALLAVVAIPITAGAMCHALGMSNVLDREESPSELREGEIPNQNSIVECCQGLVAINPVTSVVTIAYCDIEEYMQKHWDTIFSPNVKIKLAKVLLAYLSMDAFQSGLCYHVDEFSRRLEDYPLIVYASRYWSHHVREALSFGMPEHCIIERVSGFLVKRSNLESSLQIASITSKSPRIYRELLPSGREDFALYTERVKSRSTLHVAACHGLDWVVRECIDKFPEMVPNQDFFGTSALHEAAGAGSVDLVDMLSTAGAQPMIQDKDGKSPLYYAAKAGHMSIKAILLKHGDIPGSLAEGEIHDRYEENSSGYHDNIESLMEAGGQRELSSGRDGPNPSELEVAFCDAAAAGNADVVQQLLDDHENIKLEKHGTKALVLAIQREHEEVLEILLREGANPSCPDGSPAVRIPLHRAMRHGNVRIASRLLDSGANLQTRDSHNLSGYLDDIIAC